MDRICVSIFMLAYNQEKYIAQAIEGVIMQEAKFRYQLVIGEDCSTDGTWEICKIYAQQYPEKIKLVLNERNLGLGANYVKIYKECIGKYVAICDGDDYWIDPLKLQKQVEFLESNPHYRIVYTNNRNLYPSGEIKKYALKVSQKTTSFEKLVLQNYIPSVTVLFRKSPLPASMENWIKKLPFGDWPTYLWITKGGYQIMFLEEVTAVYRKNFGTSTVLRQKRSRMGEINLHILQNLKREPGFEENIAKIEDSIIRIKTGLMASYVKEMRIGKSLGFFTSLLFQSNPWTLIKIYVYSLKRTLFHTL